MKKVSPDERRSEGDMTTLTLSKVLLPLKPSVKVASVKPRWTGQLFPSKPRS